MICPECNGALAPWPADANPPRYRECQNPSCGAVFLFGENGKRLGSLSPFAFHDIRIQHEQLNPEPGSYDPWGLCTCEMPAYHVKNAPAHQYKGEPVVIHWNADKTRGHQCQPRLCPETHPTPWHDWAKPEATVKRVALDGTAEDTYATEAEHNGYRSTQARLLDAPKKAPAVPMNQGVLL